MQFFSILAAVLIILITPVASATDVTDEAICRAAGIGAGNISSYKEKYFDENPQETMHILNTAKARLPSIPAFYRKKVNMLVVNKASTQSWISVEAALNEFGKLCPCGGQSPCYDPVTILETVKP